MSDLLVPLAPFAPAGPDPETPVHVDRTIEVEESRWRWELRAAQWRARELAERVFGGSVAARLAGGRSRGAFRGLLHLDVPFRDLDTHRALEATFLACAERDPVLGAVPLVYVLGPALG